jgi:hypothetical protein
VEHSDSSAPDQCSRTEPLQIPNDPSLAHREMQIVVLAGLRVIFDRERPRGCPFGQDDSSHQEGCLSFGDTAVSSIRTMTSSSGLRSSCSA